MTNILFILIAPLFPLWATGQIIDSPIEDSPKEEVTYCKLTGEICGADIEEEKEPEKEKKYEGHNIFPEENAPITGVYPVKEGTAPNLKIWAGSSVAIDVGTGTILHYDQGREKTQIASLTKIMTAILAVENIENLEEEVVTITREALILPGTRVGCVRTGFCPTNKLHVGEEIMAIDLLKALLMNSANDSAVALAIHIAGTEKDFVKMMNEKAEELGFIDTSFCTASGLEIDGKENDCYSTAYDIARIAAYSLRHEVIWDIMKIKEGEFYSCDGENLYQLKNTDELLETLPNCIGGKTGFTPLAGKSLLTGAVDPTGEHKIIAVILNDPERWDDMKDLIDWIFKNYKWK